MTWESAERARLFDDIPSGVVVLDGELTVVDQNRAFADVFGDAIGQPCYRATKGRTSACASCPALATFADGRPRVIEQKGCDRDGRDVHYLVQVSPVSDAAGHRSHVAAITTDLTATKRLQHEYQTLFEKVPCFVAVINRNHRVVKANEAFRRVFGEPTGEQCYRLFKHRHEPCAECLVDRTFADGGSYRKRQMGLSRDGQPTPYLVYTAPLVESDGRITHVIEMALDMTEQQRLEHEKLEAERLAAVGQTVAGLAHGIKNIITGLEGGMYVTSSGMRRGDQERVRLGWEMLSRNMSRISELTKNLLAFSRGERPEFSEVRPASVAEEVVELYRDTAAEQGVALRAEVDDVPPARMDSEGLHSALANLVSNAVDACVVGDDPEPKVVVRVSEDDGTIVCEVADTGCGMDYEVKQKAFTSFFTTKTQGGTGLGLLLTHKIVQQHGGRIELESEAGHGTSFKLLFPRDRLPAEEEPT